MGAVVSLCERRLILDVKNAKDALDAIDLPPPDFLFPNIPYAVEFEKTVRAEYQNLYNDEKLT